MADLKYISKIVKGSDTLWIKDAEARQDIEDIKSSITGGMHYLGKSTTAIADGDATGPWTIDGVVYVLPNYEIDDLLDLLKQITKGIVKYVSIREEDYLEIERPDNNGK